MAFPDGWQYRCPIAIDADQVDDTLADWPLLLTEANLPAEIFTAADADGSDIRASSDQDGAAELAVQVVSFIPGSSTAQIWVQVPSVSAVADTAIYLWFGNASATMPAADSAFGSQAVWDNGYAAVWHLEESGNATVGEYKDATANANHGQGGGGDVSKTPARVASQIGYGQDCDGSGDDIVAGDIDIVGGITIAVWAKPDDVTLSGSFRVIAGKRNGSYANKVNYAFDKMASPPDELRFYFNVAGTWHIWATTDANLTTDWQYLAVTYNEAADPVFYRNGQPATISRLSGSGYPPLPTNAANTVIAHLEDISGGDLSWQGLLDNLNLANVARSAAWIAADYRSQSSPGTFAAAGAVESLSSTTPVAVSGSASATFTVTGTMRGLSHFSGTASAAFSASGTVHARRKLSGTASSVFTVSGRMRTIHHQVGEDPGFVRRSTVAAPAPVRRKAASDSTPVRRIAPSDQPVKRIN